jgi:hypothetical protein
MKDLIPVQENYGWKNLPDSSRRGRCRLHLAAEPSAGRRYLIEDGSSISKGVAVLSRVNDDINSASLFVGESKTVRPRRRRNVEYW